MDTKIAATQMYSYSKNVMEAYAKVMKPLCEKIDMPQTALDILLFVANNPGYETAKDICKYRYLKPGIVSFHVEKLVLEKYLVRETINGDRRKCKLVCTQKAKDIIEQGKKIQEEFAERITRGFSEADKDKFSQYLKILENNIENIKGMPTEAAKEV